MYTFVVMCDFNIWINDTDSDMKIKVKWWIFCGKVMEYNNNVIFNIFIKNGKVQMEIKRIKWP